MIERTAIEVFWLQDNVRVISRVDGPLIHFAIEGALTRGLDARFTRRVQHLMDQNNSDATIVDFRQCAILLGSAEAADALAPVFVNQRLMPRPIAIVCSPDDFDHCNDFASRIGHSRAVSRAFIDVAAAIAWTTQKGKVWRARRIEIVRLRHRY